MPARCCHAGPARRGLGGGGARTRGRARGEDDAASPDTVGDDGRFPDRARGREQRAGSRLTLEIDLRDTRLDTREKALGEIRRAAEEICARGGRWRWSFPEIDADPPGARRCAHHRDCRAGVRGTQGSSIAVAW